MLPRARDANSVDHVTLTQGAGALAVATNALAVPSRPQLTALQATRDRSSMSRYDHLGVVGASNPRSPASASARLRRGYFQGGRIHGYRILFCPRHEYAVLAGTGHSQIQLQSLMWMSPDGGDHRGSGDETFTGVGGTVVTVSGRAPIKAHKSWLSSAVLPTSQGAS